MLQYEQCLCQGAKLYQKALEKGQGEEVETFIVGAVSSCGMASRLADTEDKIAWARACAKAVLDSTRVVNGGMETLDRKRFGVLSERMKLLPVQFLYGLVSVVPGQHEYRWRAVIEVQWRRKPFHVESGTCRGHRMGKLSLDALEALLVRLEGAEGERLLRESTTSYAGGFRCVG